MSCTLPVLEVTDAQLLKIARLGNQDAFGELVRRYYSRCLNLAISILRDHGEAEEETQNACWKAFLHLDQFEGDAEFVTWLMRIVKNQCLMLIRRRRGVQFVRLDSRGPDDGNEPIQLPAPGRDPEGEFGSREVRQALQMEIRRIPSILRNVILLRDVKELPIADVAAQLGITVPAAKSRLLRARVELHERMMRHCGKSGACTLVTAAADSPQIGFRPYLQPKG